MKENYGLLDRDLMYIRISLEKFPEIEKAVLFGSRAIGNYKRGSDVDLVIIGAAVTNATLLSLNEWLNEIYPLPYFFDLHDYKDITNENLKKHIKKYGKEIYHGRHRSSV